MVSNVYLHWFDDSGFDERSSTGGYGVVRSGTERCGAVCGGTE